MRKLERAFKRTMIRLAGPLFPPRRSALRESILLVRVDDRLGNLVLLSPAIDWIRQARPDVRIDLLASRAFSSIYEADPRIDRLILVDKTRQKRFFPTFFADLSRAGAARAGSAVDCSDRSAFSFSSALYTLATRAPKRVGFSNDLASCYLTDPIDPPRLGHAAADPVILAARSLGAEMPPQIPHLSLQLPPPSREWTARLDSMEEGASGRIVGIHVGGRGAKRWPIERFVELAGALLDATFRPWIFRGPMEAGSDGAFRALEAKGLVLFPSCGIAEIAHAFRRCRLFVAPDTGPMHLASAVGTPTLAIFLSSDPARYRPYGPLDRALDARGSDLDSGSVADQALARLRAPVVGAAG